MRAVRKTLLIVPVMVLLLLIATHGGAAFAASAPHGPPPPPPGVTAMESGFTITEQPTAKSGGVTPDISLEGGVCTVTPHQQRDGSTYTVKEYLVANCNEIVVRIDLLSYGTYGTAWAGGNCTNWSFQGALTNGNCTYYSVAAADCPANGYAYWDNVPRGTEYTTWVEACAEFADGQYPCADGYTSPAIQF
jgi:hypothetical protein